MERVSKEPVINYGLGVGGGIGKIVGPKLFAPPQDRVIFFALPPPPHPPFKKLKLVAPPPPTSVWI